MGKEALVLSREELTKDGKNGKYYYYYYYF
jgi:hypothetical protein